MKELIGGIVAVLLMVVGYIFAQATLDGLQWLAGVLILWVRNLGRKSMRQIVRENDFDTIRLQLPNALLSAFAGFLIVMLSGMVLMFLWIGLVGTWSEVKDAIAV